LASLIISDTHFGLDSSTLKSPEKVDQLLREVWEFEGGCDDVVLLGDILDFWRVRPENAVKEAIPLLKRLSLENLKVRYVVGNHDHHLVVQKQEAEFMERAARGDLFPVYIPSIRWRRTFCGIDIEMLYPTYWARCCQRSILFTHGHHLDGIQNYTLQLVEKLRRLSGEEFLPSDLEMMMTYAYEGLYRSACIGEMVSFENSIWKASGLLQRINAGVFSNQHRASAEGQYEAILNFIRERNLGRIDCFIYGDTHRPGIFQRNGGPLVVNAGSFTREGRNGSSLETPDTYMFMDEKGLAIRQLGRRRPLFLCELH
jgi:UDP-2,3-diacylglucosamine pyrophosphatase LpxH